MFLRFFSAQKGDIRDLNKAKVSPRILRLIHSIALHPKVLNMKFKWQVF